MTTRNPIEQRMEEFVAVFGELPEGACKLQDYEARYHSNIWIQRLLGEGLACNYVIGYHLDGKWWTFCFDRREASNGGDEEVWVIEGYDSVGRSWRESYLYCAPTARWRRAPAEDRPRGSQLDTGTALP